MPIFEINGTPYFVSHSELHEMDLLRHFIYYNDDQEFKKFDDAQIETVKNYLLGKNSKGNLPKLFDFDGWDRLCATSELLFYAGYNNSRNPLITGYNYRFKNDYALDEEYYTYPYKHKTSLFDKSGIKLKDRYLTINVDFSSVKRVWGCMKLTAIECENFFIAISLSKISIHHDKNMLRSFDSNFQCQGKIEFNSRGFFSRNKFKIFIDRELLYSNKVVEVYSSYETYLSANSKVVKPAT
jgi:hypothetical protein